MTGLAAFLSSLAALPFFKTGVGPQNKIADGFEALNVYVTDETRLEISREISTVGGMQYE